MLTMCQRTQTVALYSTQAVLVYILLSRVLHCNTGIIVQANWQCDFNK